MMGGAAVQSPQAGRCLLSHRDPGADGRAQRRRLVRDFERPLERDRRRGSIRLLPRVNERQRMIRGNPGSEVRPGPSAWKSKFSARCRERS